MALSDPTRVLRISVFHRSAGGSGSNSMFENAANHPEAIVEAMRWLGTVAEAHDCAGDAYEAFGEGIEARKRCEAAIGLRPDGGEAVHSQPSDQAPADPPSSSNTEG